MDHGGHGLKPLRSETDYEAALAEIDRLIVLDPPPGSADGDQLDALVALVRAYEAHRFKFDLPTPVEAIRFRLDQLGLTQKDLTPFIGSRGRVSEVLSGKRSLTLHMMRQLHVGLGVPASVLLSAQPDTSRSVRTLEHEYPVRELVRREWLPRVTSDALQVALHDFLAPLERISGGAVYLRTAAHVRSRKALDRGAVNAWLARVAGNALTLSLPPFDPRSLNHQMLAGLSHLSVFEDGPRLAQQYLAKHGIALVAVDHLPKTYLDGAAFMLDKRRPVIGITLRFDRVDNFWFTLAHECAHLLLHVLKDPTLVFIDDLESHEADDAIERDADALAAETLVPDQHWRSSAVSRTPTPAYARQLARELGIHPAIVAGRVRRTRGNYQVLGSLLGHGTVRDQLRTGT